MTPPDRPFGLFLSSEQVTDAVLVELVGLKNLHALYIHSSNVSDAGLTELTELRALA